MLEVLCSVLVVLGTGERKLVDAKGFVGDEGQDSLLVHFESNLGAGTSAKWVRENDCLYIGDPVKGYQDYLHTKALEQAAAAADMQKWKKFIEKLPRAK